MATYYAINVPKTQQHEVPYYGAGTVKTLFACLNLHSLVLLINMQSEVMLRVVQNI